MNPNIPLAEKLRPKTLDEVLGQEHLTGENGTIRKMLENDTLNSLILWGPPGTGKTTLAEIISSTSGRKFLEAHIFCIFSLVFVLQPLAFFPKLMPT